MAEVTLQEKLITEFPELAEPGAFFKGIINLVDRGDGKGVVITKWDYEKPLPKSLEAYLDISA